MTELEPKDKAIKNGNSSFDMKQHHKDEYNSMLGGPSDPHQKKTMGFVSSPGCDVDSPSGMVPSDEAD